MSLTREQIICAFFEALADDDTVVAGLLKTASVMADRLAREESPDPECDRREIIRQLQQRIDTLDDDISSRDADIVQLEAQLDDYREEASGVFSRVETVDQADVTDHGADAGNMVEEDETAAAIATVPEKPEVLTAKQTECLETFIALDASGANITKTLVSERMGYTNPAGISCMVNALKEKKYLKTSGQRANTVWTILKLPDGSRYVREGGAKLTQCPPAYAAGYGIKKPNIDYR